MINSKRNNLIQALLLSVSVCALAFSLCISSLPNVAYADVRKADIVCGQTVEQRGLAAADCPAVEGEYVILVDSNGRVYFERNAHEPTQIASITKVMTAMVAIDNANPDAYIAVSNAAATVGESSANLMEGDVMDFDAALKALLVPSGNDASVAIAEAVGASMIAADPSLGSDPMQVFVDAMNAKAEEIGCVDTIYENPHGLDFDEWAGNLHSTASDQALVAKAALNYEKIRNIVSGGSTSIAVTRGGEKVIVDLETTDELLEMYEYTIGVKTGVTQLAGPSFMGAANKDGIELYSLVLDSSNEWQRFADTRELFEWGYDHMVDVPLANSASTATMTMNGTNTQVPIIAEVSHTDWIDRTVKATIEDPTATVRVFDLEGNVVQTLEFDKLSGTVREGQRVGKITYTQHGTIVAQQNLIACETVAAPDIFEGIGIGWNRFIGGFSGEPEYADSLVYNVMPIINNNVSVAA